jgi:DNA-binding winged helix-turn-helix (wHTH) protein
LSRQNGDGSLAPVVVGSRALEILGLLIDRHGDIVSRDEILEIAWRGVVEGADVTVEISVLRRALDDRGSAGSIIQTIPRRGYRFVDNEIARSSDPTQSTGPIYLVCRTRG